MTIKIKRRCFTLIELMVVIALLSLLGGMLLIKAKGLMDNYHFRQDCKKFKGYIELAHELALCYRSDIQLDLYIEAGYMIGELKSDEPVLRRNKMFFRPIKFKSLKSITIAGYDAEKIVFSGSGWMWPAQEMVLHSHRQDAVATCLDSLSVSF